MRGEFLLVDDVTTPNTYWSILHCIGNGISRISEIAGRLGMPASQLTSYMSALQDLGWVSEGCPWRRGIMRGQAGDI